MSFDLKETFTPDCKCPECGYKFDAATPVGTGQPKKGDLSICLNCGGINEFNEDLTISPIEVDKKLEAMLGKEQGPKIIKTIEFIKARGRFFHEKGL